MLSSLEWIAFDDFTDPVGNWRLCELDHLLLSPRASALMAPYGEKTILIYGGETADGKTNQGMIINIADKEMPRREIHVNPNIAGTSFPNNSYIITEEKNTLAAGN